METIGRSKYIYPNYVVQLIPEIEETKYAILDKFINKQYEESQ